MNPSELEDLIQQSLDEFYRRRIKKLSELRLSAKIRSLEVCGVVYLNYISNLTLFLDMATAASFLIQKTEETRYAD